MSMKIRRQERLNMIEKKDFKRELLGKYMVKMLYR